MGFLEEARAESARTRPGPSCGVRTMLQGVEDETLAAEMVEALADRTIAHVAILKVLHARNFKVSRSIVEAHRRGSCACARDVR